MAVAASENALIQRKPALAMSTNVLDSKPSAMQMAPNVVARSDTKRAKVSLSPTRQGELMRRRRFLSLSNFS